MSGNVPSDKKVADLSALLEISKAMAVEKDLMALLDLIVHRATQVMQAERTSLFLVDHEQQELWTRIAEGLEIREIRLPVGKGISGTVAQTKEVINIPEPYSDPRFDSSWDRKTGFRTRSILCVPLVTHEDKVVGVIQVLNKAGGPFTSYDETLLSAFASHAAIALDQADLIQHYVEKKKMAAALEVAQQIQTQVLPTESPLFDGFDLYGHCWPCDETGGDYYDFIELPNGQMGLTVGDVTGHGVGSALMMMGSRSLLRALLRMETDLKCVFTQFNDLLSCDVRQGMFITLFYGALDAEAHTVTYLSAGHEPGLLVRAATGEIEELGSDAPPMGILDDVEFPSPTTCAFEPGDTLFLCTDGLTEATNAKGQMFGRERLYEALRANIGEPAEHVVEALNRAVREFVLSSKDQAEEEGPRDRPVGDPQDRPADVPFSARELARVPFKDDLTLVAARAIHEP